MLPSTIRLAYRLEIEIGIPQGAVPPDFEDRVMARIPAERAAFLAALEGAISAEAADLAFRQGLAEECAAGSEARQRLAARRAGATGAANAGAEHADAHEADRK